MNKLIFLILSFLISFSVYAQDYSKPNSSSSYTNFSGEIRANVDAATKINPSSGSNIPEGAIWFDYANGLFKRYESSAWVARTAIPKDGWIPVPETWTYASASSFTISGDQTAVFTKGTPLKFTNSTVKYGNVLSSSYSAPNTTVNIIVNTDYVLTNTTISSTYISRSNPSDFPAYFNYDANPGGFSALTTELAVYWIIDGVLHGKAIIDGTSNSISFTIDIPAPSSLSPTFGLVSISGNGYSMNNNSSPLTTVGKIYYSAYPTMDLFRDQGNTTWTSSGGKSASIEFYYPIK